MDSITIPSAIVRDLATVLGATLATLRDGLDAERKVLDPNDRRRAIREGIQSDLDRAQNVAARFQPYAKQAPSYLE